MVSPSLRIGIIGAGWGGLAAAWRLCQAGHSVVIWDMAPQTGGRARSGVPPPLSCPVELDCGQHIMIGAYSATLALMRELGVQSDQVLHRRPLELCRPDGQGLRLPPGPPTRAFVLGVLRHAGWTAKDKWVVLRELMRWRLAGFECPEHLTVEQWCRLPPRVMEQWIEPLCVAALNTPVNRASARVLMRVLGDALFAGPGGSDLLLPKVPLHDLLPGPAQAALARQGAEIHLHRRVKGVHAAPQDRWWVDDQLVDRLIVATSAVEAARLIAPWDADWATQAQSIQHEPIVTTWVHVPDEARRPWATPMVSLAGVRGPAQFAFDLGAMGHPWKGGIALVASAPGAWLDGGVAALESAALEQARQAGLFIRSDGVRVSPQVVRSVAERRATFRCEAGMRRPRARAANGQLRVVGDYVEGPYPSTLEGAVRSGLTAADSLINS